MATGEPPRLESRLRRICGGGRGAFTALLILLATKVVIAQPVEWLVLDSWGSELGIRYRSEDETRERVGSSDLHEQEEIWEERIGLTLDGSVYHPRFLEYHLYGALLFEQQELDTDSGTPGVDSDTTNSEYDVILSILQQHPASLQLTARQRIREVRQSFFQNTELTNTNYEADLALKHSWFPTHVRLRRDEVVGEGFNETDELRDTLVVEGRHSDTSFFVDARYEHGETDILTTDQSFRTDTANGSVRKRWGEELAQLFTVTGYYRDQQGSIATTTGNATVASRHRHGEDWRSEVRLLYQESSAFGSENEGLAEEFSVSHELYESLTTTVNLGASQDDFDEGRSDSVRGEVRARYRKEIPGGRLRIGVDASREQIDEHGLGTSATAVNEPHVVQFGVPIFLDRSFVILTTILVTDVTGTIIYTEGTDYTLSVSGVLTRVDIPPSSLILDGDTILFTYQFQTSPDRVIRRDQTAADLSLDFGTQVNLFGRISRLDEVLEDGAGDADLDDQRRAEAGLILGDARRRLTLRYVDLDSRFNPYERLQGTISLTSRLPRIPFDGRGTVRLNVFHTRFPEDHTTERGYDAVARADLNITRAWTGRALLEFRSLDDRIEESSGFFAEAGLRYGGRAWSIDAVLQQSISEFEISTDQDRTRFEVRVIRRFGGRVR